VRRALLLVLAVLVPACGVSAQAEDHELRADDVPYDLLAAPTTTTTTAPPPTTTTLPWRSNVWFVRDSNVVPVPRQLLEQPDVPTLLRQLVAGPRSTDPSTLRTALNSDVRVTAMPPSGGVLALDLDPSFADLPGTEQVFALAQLVYTVTEVPGVGRITFRTAGADLAVPLPDGQLVERSVSRDDFAALVYPTTATSTAPPPAS
jgi:spore germination protein GerM